MLTTGMFNYVVKDPYSSGLSREFWIKDAAGYAILCVLELVCVFTFQELLSEPRSNKHLFNLFCQFSSSYVYSELSKSIEVLHSCQLYFHSSSECF
jgi:hypothetical protein